MSRINIKIYDLDWNETNISDNKFMDLDVSEKSYIGQDNTMQQPRRFSFWVRRSLISSIAANIENGTYEIQDNISKYHIKIVENLNTIFVGFIDTALYDYNDDNKMCKIAGYDFLSLINRPTFKEMENWVYNNTPAMILNYIIQHYKNLGLTYLDHYPYISSFEFNETMLDHEELLEINESSVMKTYVFDEYDNIGTLISYSAYFIQPTYYGTNYNKYFVVYNLKITQIRFGTNEYQYNAIVNSSFRIYLLINGTYQKLAENIDLGEWQGWHSTQYNLEEISEQTYNEFKTFLMDTIKYYDSIDQLLNGTGGSETITDNDSQVTYSYTYNASTKKYSLKATGRLFPPKIKLGKGWMENINDTKINIKTNLKAMLYLYSLTVYVNNDGNLTLKNMLDPRTGVTIIPLDDDKIFNFRRKRLKNKITDGESILSPVLGNFAIHIAYLNENNMFNQLDYIKFGVSANEGFEIGDIVSCWINNERFTWFIYSIKPDIDNNDVYIKAWRFNNDS